MTGDGDGRSLILDELGDRLDRFRLVTGGDEAERDAILAELDVRGPREAEMLEELANPRILAHPERFADAHRLVMSAMEVLARHGHRSPARGRLGPLVVVWPLVRWLIELVARYISYSYLGTLIDATRHLYGRRETQAPNASAERAMLRLARVEAERLAPGFKGNPIGVPTVLLGGAVVPIVASLVRLAGGISPTDRTVLVVGGAIAFLVTGLASWVVLRGAAMAHRRIQLATREAVGALWETVGACGRPPRDDAQTFAYVAIALTVVGWIVVPAAVGIGLALS